MPLAIATAEGRYVVLTAELAGNGSTPIGILLEDPKTNQLHVRLRRDWDSIADEEEQEVLDLLEDDLDAKGRQMGAAGLLDWLEENASCSFQVSDRKTVMVEDFTRALNRLYRQNVRSEVRQFETHIPRYSLQVAAGKFLENDEVDDEGWEEVPRDLHVLPEMFVARIVGHSMEPLIPDGSSCVFRAGVVGSRNGRLVLVENLEMSDRNRYTVKRYRRDPGKQGVITLESLNPDYPSWNLDPDQDKYRVIAEFVRVLD